MGGELPSVAVAETHVHVPWAVAGVPASPVGTLQVTLLGKPRRRCGAGSSPHPDPPSPFLKDTLSPYI